MIVQLEQGSQEWLSYRKCKFNASETPILYGRGFCNEKKLADEKLGLKESYLASLMKKTNLNERQEKIKFSVIKGQITEKTIRDEINKRYNLNFKPMVIQSDEDNRFSASLDGYDENLDCVLEIKTSTNIYLKVQNNKKVPNEYLMQCYHQLMVSKAKKLLFVSGYINDEFELKLASAILEPNDDIFLDIIGKWNNFEKKYLKCF